MGDKQETVADIVAEMRARWQGCECCPCDDLVGVDILELADRIEAARKRERDGNVQSDVQKIGHNLDNSTIGNVLEMRKALEQIASIPMPPPIHLAQQCAREMREKAIAALAEPARNCDRFGTDNAEASLAYEEFCDRAEVEESVNGAIAWLLSLDTDKEGGAK